MLKNINKLFWISALHNSLISTINNAITNLKLNKGYTLPLKQFINSITNIKKRTNVSTIYGIYKHLLWQIRKIFHLFPFTQQLSQSKIIANNQFCGVSALINSSNMYDFDNMSLLKLFLKTKHKSVFFDVGANIGSYTLIASEDSNAIIYAFEPHPSTFKHLVNNIELNHRKNVKPINIALDKESGHVEFSNTTELATNHIIRDKNESPMDETIIVNSIKAKEFCLQHTAIPNIMKIDVEGFEYDVLSGFEELLAEVSIIFLEINGLSAQRNASENNILNLLTAQGFSEPMSFDATKNEFYSYQHGSLEDPIFLNQKLLNNNKTFPLMYSALKF